MAVKSVGAKDTPEAQLLRFIEALTPADQKLFRAVRAAVRTRVPAANEMVYDYPGNLVISYTASDLGKEGVLSLAARPGDLRLYFGGGPRLPDPKKLLQGTGGLVRFIPVEAASRLKHPDVEALFVAAISLSRVPLPVKGRGKVVIMKSGAAKKPPRRKTARG
jgi:hypothetical protein